jgi:c-di-GMP-binding flagellar brake protein YcgR
MSSTTMKSVQTRSDGTLFTVAWPNYIEQLQRRAYERVAPPQGHVVAVRFWRDDAHLAAGETRMVRHGQLEDLSAGGMRIKVSEATDITLDAQYKCVFAPRAGGASLVVDATLRHREASDGGRASLGLNFLGLEATVEGRRMLDQLAKTVQHFQRSHSRRGHRENVRA